MTRIRVNQRGGIDAPSVGEGLEGDNDQRCKDKDGAEEQHDADQQPPKERVVADPRRLSAGANGAHRQLLTV